MQNFDDIAKEIAQYWSNNCIDDEFMDCCADTLCARGYDVDEIHMILNIIEEKYLNE